MPEKLHYSAQTKARKAALDILFAADQRQRGIVETFTEVRSLTTQPIRELTSTIVLGVAEHLEEIDTRLAGLLSSSWTIERMPAVDRALARIAIFELDYTSTPGPSVVAEAVKLAGDLSTDSSPGFLNGVLRSALDTSSTD